MPLAAPLRKLPTLEPVKAAIRDALTASLADSLADVAARFPDPAIVLPFPKRIVLNTIRSYDTIQRNAWPTISIETEDLGAVKQTQQLHAGEWQGGVAIYAWLQNPDRELLDLSLDRYAAAIWQSLTQYDRLAGASIVPDTAKVQPDASGGSATKSARAVALYFDMRVWC